MLNKSLVAFVKEVLPLAREWIEILATTTEQVEGTVLPLAREWIEIQARSADLRTC